MNQINENENKGFSLVELIVVIAIMAVLTSVLAPSLLGYVENSRAQKDDSAMGEVTNVIKIAMANQDIYDECLEWCVSGNYSCYTNQTLSSTPKKIIDKCYNGVDHTESGKEAPCVANAETGTKADAWHYGDEERTDDEKAYQADGYMRGLTITFISDKDAPTITFANAEVNKISKKVSDTRTIDSNKQGTLSGMGGKLYNKLCDEVGTTITRNSQAYRNSEYTVFIRMGTSGESVSVYGQWDGTNLEAPSKQYS